MSDIDDSDLLRLQELLARVAPPLEPLDVSAIDGLLCGVLLQPRPVSPERWLPLVTDGSGRPAPAGPGTAAIQALARRRHDELQRAIQARQWFDPWLFEVEIDDEAREGGREGDEAADEPAPGSAAVSASVLPWVAGFELAMESFPQLLDLDAPAALTEPLALLYLHFDAQDLDAQAGLVEAIEAIEPPATLAEAAEDLVRAVLLLADVSQPLQARPAAPARPREPRRAAKPRPPSRRR